MKDLRYVIDLLSRENELLRIKENFSSDLEISYFTNIVQKNKGPALLFERVDGKERKVLMNLFGTTKRLEMSIGSSIEEISSDFQDLIFALYKNPGLLEGLRIYKKLKNLSVNEKSHAPVKEKSEITLDDIPILRTWPKDASRFITFPVVITRDPETGTYNAGTYRMQVFDSETTGMHWQAQKTGAMHLKKAKEMHKTLDVAVVIGVHPAILFSSISPLPEGFDEMSFAGYLMGESVEVVRGETVDLRYPANAEIVLEGYVDPEELREEGPFGDHTGYYTPKDLYPVFHIKKIFHRKDFIYHATVVGKLWNEDVIIGKAIERIFLPAIRFQIPDIVDLSLPEEGVFNDICVVSIKKKYPGQGRKVGMAILSSGQLMFTKYVIVVDDDIDVKNMSEVIWAVATRTDPYRDVEIIRTGVADSIDHASWGENVGGKMIIDATRKFKEEGFDRPWPEKIEFKINDELMEKVKRYGFRP